LGTDHALDQCRLDDRSANERAADLQRPSGPFIGANASNFDDPLVVIGVFPNWAALPGSQ
jgi:hypothetical protein